MVKRATEAALAELRRQATEDEGAYLGDDGNGGGDTDPEWLLIDGRVDLPAVVRAVIAAMREPDGELVDAGAGSFDGYEPGTFHISVAGQPTKAWHAMIDAALKD